MAKDNDRKRLVAEATKKIRAAIDIKRLTPEDACKCEFGNCIIGKDVSEENMSEFKSTYESALLRCQGKVWPVMKDNLLEWLSPEAIQTIDRESGEILDLIVDSGAGKPKRKGLVVGYVQSGKTTNYSAVIAKAIDRGYRFIIVLAGMHNILREQTQKRLEDYIGTAYREMNQHIQLLTHRGADIEDEVSWYPETTSLAVVKKQSERLQALLDLMEKAKSEGELDDVKVLMIDDESDQATPNTAEQREEYSKVNKLIRQIWDQVQQGSYVAYTATPFANFLMNPNDEERYTEFVKSDDSDKSEDETIERYPGLYPSDFIYALGRPKGYIGASHIFGNTLLDAQDEDGTFVGEVEIDAVRNIEEEEAKILRPLTRKDGGNYMPKMVPTLEAAVQWFMIATALRRSRTQKKQHSSMLIHLSHLTETHFEVEKVIKNYISKLKENCGKPEINDAMQSLYEREVDCMRGINPNGVYPKWDELKINVVDVINDAKCIVKNSSTKNQKEELVYKEGEPATYIVIGGNALSRGLTLEGLICSYYLRTSKTYDALLQMGRWFGFRAGYEDLIRLWTTEDIQEDYRYLADIEDEIREEIRKIEDPSVVTVKIRDSRERLNVTSPNKMRNAVPENINSDKTYQVTVIEEQNDEILNNNIQALESLIKSIGSTQEALREKNNGSYLFEGVSVGTIIEYLTNYQVDSSNPGMDSDRLVEWITENVTQNWNVVIYSNTKENQPAQGFAGYEIRMANRSAVANIPTGGITSIGDLVNSRTYQLDLRILGSHGRIQISEERGYDRSLYGDFPLLVIYVLNPKSEATVPNRRNLDARKPVVLHAIVFPEITKYVTANHLTKGNVGSEEE